MNDNTSEIKSRVSALLCHRTVENLAKHNFDAHYCESAADVTAFLLNAAAHAKTIGFGGSRSLADLNLETSLAASGAEILNHNKPDLPADVKNDFMHRQQTCDLFLSGVNAVTVNGEIVNSDGVGNRVSASIYGPTKIILVVGRNKIVNGDIGEAIKRVKDDSAPQNCARLNKKTPCAQTGLCADCSSPERICNVTVIMDRKPSRSDVTVLVVNEDLGF